MPSAGGREDHVRVVLEERDGVLWALPQLGKSGIITTMTRADGVVVVPRAAAVDVARLGTERVAKEQKTRERLRQGELGLDFYGFRARLAELGVQYVDKEQE